MANQTASGTSSRGTTPASIAGLPFDLPFDLTDLQDRATRTAKAAYDKASTFARENPRAATGIGLALGALFLSRLTRR
jgi:hypothetical protein